MKYHETSHILWLEKEIQVLTNPDSYIHKQNWQLGKKKDKHPLSDVLVETGKKFAMSKNDEDKNELLNIIKQLQTTI